MRRAVAAVALLVCTHLQASPRPDAGVALGCERSGREVPADALAPVAAMAAPRGKAVQVVGFMLLAAQPCPPCPRHAVCEACLPPFSFVGEKPLGARGGGGSIWADLSATGCAPQVGDQLLLHGHWETVTTPGTDRVFRADRVVILAAAERQ